MPAPETSWPTKMTNDTLSLVTLGHMRYLMSNLLYILFGNKFRVMLDRSFLDHILQIYNMSISVEIFI